MNMFWGSRLRPRQTSLTFCHPAHIRSSFPVPPNVDPSLNLPAEGSPLQSVTPPPSPSNGKGQFKKPPCASSMSPPPSNGKWQFEKPPFVQISSMPADPPPLPRAMEKDSLRNHHFHIICFRFEADSSGSDMSATASCLQGGPRSLG